MKKKKKKVTRRASSVRTTFCVSWRVSLIYTPASRILERVSLSA